MGNLINFKIFTFLKFIFLVALVRCSVKNDVLKNYAKFTGKYVSEVSFFNKLADLRLNTGAFQ